MFGDIFAFLVLLFFILMLLVPALLGVRYVRSAAMPDTVRYAMSRYCVTEDSRKGMKKVPGTALFMIFDGTLLSYMFKISISTEGVLLRERPVLGLMIYPLEFLFPWKALRSPKPKKLQGWASYYGRDKMQVDVKGTDICVLIDAPTFEKHFASHFAQSTVTSQSRPDEDAH